MEYDPHHPSHASEAEMASHEPDLLDEPALPPITLSAAALLAISSGAPPAQSAATSSKRIIRSRRAGSPG